ncbi:MAG: Tetratricopeptide 1 repeat-containing protein [Caulobacteraceae bacterium]|nr:Tetratricopeptide 1 repeat-containing protein [Caulobacteraceae bacterium]
MPSTARMAPNADDPKDPSYRRELRRLGQLFARGDFEGLLSAADCVLARFPDSPTGHRARAVALLRVGRPAEAVETLATSVISQRDAEAASLLGLALFGCGELERSLEALARARRIDNRFAPAWANLGTVLAAQGNRAGAGRAFRRALALDPMLADARCDYGRMLFESGQAKRALEVLKPAFDPKGRPLALHLLLARVCASRSDRAGELAAANAAVVAAPRSAEARLALGAALQASGHHEASLAPFRRAARLQPGDVRAAVGAAGALRKLGRMGTALGVLTRALRRNPGSPILEGARANLLFHRRDLAGALAAAGRAQAAAPADAGVHFLLGSILLWASRAEEARAAYAQGLALNGRDPAGWNGLGLLDLVEGRFREAARAFNNGLKVHPNHPACLFSLGLTALTLGDWVSGWPLYEWRWLGSSLGLDLARPNVPGVAWWAGEALEGKRLLVLGEQGFGDNFQFARLLQLLPEPAEVVYAVAKPLQRVMRQSFTELPFPVEVIEVAQIPRARADAFITLMSIPARVGLTQETLPPFAPWLRTDAVEVEAWRARLPSDRPRVGFVWRGNPALVSDHWRSTDLAEWRPLLRDRAVTWVSLQKLEGRSTRENRILERDDVIDRTEELGDFAATAALIESLDLVIAVDTSVAHLAGALGKPVWLLNRANSEWRWGWKQTRCDWYPHMRIFNQDTLGDWRPVLARVNRELGGLLRRPTLP